MFDFWFEFRYVVPKGYTRFLGKVSELTDSGIEVHFFTGNHDQWCRHYFEEECGMIMHREPFLAEIMGKEFFLAHGDEFSKDRTYRILSRIFHSRITRKMFSSIHPRWPMIQPPFMNLLTTPEQRKIKMVQTRQVSKTERIIFPIVVTLFVALLLPDTAPLIGCLMLGNLFKETGLTDRLSDTVQNALMNIVTILLSTAVGATMVGSNFLTWETIKIVVLGVCAFILSTVGGLLAGKVMCILTKGKVNPLIGSAGVSAVPMAARVANLEGQKANPSNFLLMHAMGPNVAGVIGSAIAAGFLLKVFG